ncbi:MAG: methyltransferase domain-containing protein [Synergistaceae bacterium]|nr:methyltransferase domain-containing protein [Synergistaceae bacterium]
MKELLRAPKDIGALCPSSSALANEMARPFSASFLKSGFLVELGAGTGPVTEALLRRGIPPSKIAVVEKSEALALCLKERFPDANVICCPAEELKANLNGLGPVLAVVSSLPFRSLPSAVGMAIMSEAERVLAPGGLFVQFTYALLGEMPYIPKSFRKVRSKLILRNVPPAKVEVFRKLKAGACRRETAR